MTQKHVSALVLAIALCGAPAFAQHGHGMGPSAGGNSMASSHSSTSGGSVAAAHGQTMDQILTKNTKLSGTIASLTGESAQTACANFKNLGQCVAAAHVSKNLGISFACLKSNMTGTAAPTGASCPAGTAAATGTGTKGMSLGKSIQSLSPTANSKSEAKKAQQQANQDIKDSTSNS